METWTIRIRSTTATRWLKTWKTSWREPLPSTHTRFSPMGKELKKIGWQLCWKLGKLRKESKHKRWLMLKRQPFPKWIRGPLGHQVPQEGHAGRVPKFPFESSAVWLRLSLRGRSDLAFIAPAPERPQSQQTVCPFPLLKCFQLTFFQSNCC